MLLWVCACVFFFGGRTQIRTWCGLLDRSWVLGLTFLFLKTESEFTSCSEIKFEEAAVLHYTYTKFSDLTSRRDRCGCKPTKEDVKRCFMLEFDRAVRTWHLLCWGSQQCTTFGSSFKKRFFWRFRTYYPGSVLYCRPSSLLQQLHRRRCGAGISIINSCPFTTLWGVEFLKHFLIFTQGILFNACMWNIGTRSMLSGQTRSWTWSWWGKASWHVSMPHR